MYQRFAILLVGLTAAQGHVSAQEKQAGSDPYSLRGEVLDVFDGNQVLLGIGKDQGARKGLVGSLYQTLPEPRFFGEVEFVEVGAKHSVVRLRPTPPYPSYWSLLMPAPKQAPAAARPVIQPKEGDTVIWRSLRPREIPELPRIYPYSPGGAMIDLSK